MKSKILKPWANSHARVAAHDREERFYLGGYGDNALCGHVIAFDAGQSTPRWDVDLGSGSVWGLACAGGRVVARCHTATIVLDEASGSTLHSGPVDLFGSQTGGRISRDGRYYAGIRWHDGYTVAAIDIFSMADFTRIDSIPLQPKVIAHIGWDALGDHLAIAELSMTGTVVRGRSVGQQADVWRFEAEGNLYAVELAGGRLFAAHGPSGSVRTDDASLVAYDVPSGAVAWKVPLLYRASETPIAVSTSRGIIAGGGTCDTDDSHTLSVWSLADGAHRWQGKHTRGVRWLAMSSSGRSLVTTGAYNGAAPRSWDLSRLAAA